MTYLACALISLMLLRGRKGTTRATITFASGLLSLVVALSIASLFERWSGTGQEGRSFVDRPLEAALLLTMVGCLVASISATSLIWRYFYPYSIFQLIAIIAVLLMSIFNSRVGDEAIRDNSRPIAFLLIVATLALLFSKQLSLEMPQKTRPHNLLRNGCLFGLALAGALRIDGVRTGGAWYHVSYFTGVVKSIRDGGILLWDTPSQYGFLNLQLAALAPFRDPQRAFFVYQAALMVLVGFVVLFTLKRLAMSPGLYALFGFSFIILLNLADPALVGPQPFPSSSVLRFGPSVVVLSLIFYWDETLRNDQSKKVQIYLAVIIGISALWSFESTFYTSLVLLGWLVGGFGDRLGSTKLSLKVIAKSALVSLGIMVTYTVYVFFRVGEIPNWTWYVLAASRFAGGFGALPLDPWGAVWIPILALMACITLVRSGPPSLKKLGGASSGAIIGWLSYFVGRSHSSNVLAIFPLLFVAVVLTLFAAMRLQSTQVRAQISTLDADNIFSQRHFTIPYIGTAIFASVVISAVLANQSLPNLFRDYRTVFSTPAFEEAAQPSDSLISFLDQANLSKLPIAYQGNLAMLPDLDSSIRNRLDIRSSWLPAPLALLEDPIPPSVREQVLKRWSERGPTDGYFLWDKANSIPGRATAWLEALDKTHLCKVVSESEDWQLSKCVLRTS